MKKIFLTVGLVLISFIFCFAQEQTARLGTIVKNVQVRDSKNNPIWLPQFGEKHLLIFYPDPDHPTQNKKFTDYLEDNQIVSDNIHAFGVANLKDAPMLPNGVVRSIIRMKEKKTGATIYTDPDHLLRDAWGLGDVNNKFTFIFVTKEGEIVYLKKGVLSDKDIEEFFEVIEKYQ